MVRSARTTKKQIYLLTHFINDNPEMIETGKPEHQVKWHQLTDYMNSSGQGPQKSCQDWKKVFAELKTNARRHARLYTKYQGAYVSGQPVVKPLNESEELLLKIVGSGPYERQNDNSENTNINEQYIQDRT